MQDYKNIKKIFITGLPGSGKTTLAVKLSSLLEIKTYDFDDIKFTRKFNIERGEKEQERATKKILNEKSWVVEGAQLESALPFWENADLVVFLQIKEFTLYKRIIFRYLKRLFFPKEKIAGNDFILLKRVYNYFHKPNNFLSEEKYKAYLKQYAKKYIIIEKNKDFKKTLKTMQRSLPTPTL